MSRADIEHAERAAIGAALLSQESLDALLDACDPGDFGDARCRNALEAMRELAGLGSTVDEVSTASRIRTTERGEPFGGDAFAWLSGVASATPIGEQIASYIAQIRDRAARRRIHAAAVRAGEAAKSSALPVERIADEAATEMSAAAQRADTRLAVSPRELLPAELARIEAARDGKLSLGTATGLRDLDALTGGMHDGNLVVVAGRPGMGKSALGLQFALAAASTGGRALVFSLEMSAQEVNGRWLAMRSGVAVESLRTGRLKDTDWPRLARGVSELSEMPLGINDKGALSVLEVRSIARRYKAQSGGNLRLVIVDYLQLMRGEGESREQAIAGVSRGLKALAKELAVPVVALSQLNRSCEARADKIPQLSDLRESGAIEQDADCVILVFREDYYNAQTQRPGIADLIVAKNRHGQGGTVAVKWRPSITSFADLAHEQQGGRY